MKTYKLNNVEVSAEEIQKLVRDNPDLLKPEVKGRYFFPTDYTDYWVVNSYGEIMETTEDRNVRLGKHIEKYATEEQAELECKKKQAIVACWKWAQENAPFEPDWGDIDQGKYFTCYNYEERKLDWRCVYYIQYQFTLPYFKSIEDHEAFIKANKENLELLFTK